MSYSFAQWNSSKYYVTLAIQLSISHLFKQLNYQATLFLAIQFSINLVWKQSYLIHREGPIRCYLSRQDWTWERWKWKCTPRSQKLQDCSLILSKTHVRESYPSDMMKSLYATAPSDWDMIRLMLAKKKKKKN